MSVVTHDDRCSPQLTSIPEMLACIFEYLRYSKYDLWGCCLVNKQWSALAMPLLWQNPTFSSTKSLKAFQKTIIENPQVAKLVTELYTDRYKRHEVYPLTELVAYLPALKHVYFDATHYVNILLGSSKDRAPSFTNLKGIRFLEISPGAQGWAPLITTLNNCPQLEDLGLLINGDLHMTLSAIPSDFPDIKSLTSLDLQYYPQTASVDFFRSLITFMPNLRRFKLYSFFISADIVKVISQNCHNLEALHLISAFMPADITAHKIFEYVATNQFGHKLREFWLNLVNYTQYIGALDIPSGVMHRFCDALSHVNDLQLCGITFNHGTMRYFANNISENLKSFKLSKIYCRDIQGVFNTEVWEILFRRCGHSLESLAIEYLELPSNIGQVIGTLCVQLKVLCFRYTTISEESILDITEALGDRLEHLELRNTGLSTAGLSHVLRNCHHLEYLDIGDRLTRPSVSECGFREFIHRCGVKLTYLNFNDCWITNSHLEFIASFCWQLSVLKLINQQGLSDERIERIMMRCRRLENLFILQEPHVSSGLTKKILAKIKQEFIYI
ncbi:hypothetical protein K7432_015360 [Basidiobolus ranarum]|uniref:F-box domain-containing protein n=1 Tax=Basidiobolus ranarum TaxID=34480 RepID=A0ABR2VN63_9FUNG